MRYESLEKMNEAHITDIIETAAPAYVAHIQAAFGVALHMMLAFHKNDLKKVEQDILSLCEHYLARCTTLLKEQQVPAGETLH